MATIKEYEKLTVKERQNRYFSEEFKRKKVSELDRNLVTVAQVSREYQVNRAAVYKWVYKYSAMRKKGLRQVVEPKSDGSQFKALKDEIKELHRIIGEKQLKIDFQAKMIDLVESEYKIDIKKNFSGSHSSGTGSTGKRTK